MNAKPHGRQPFHDFSRPVFSSMVTIREGMNPEVKYSVERPSLNLRQGDSFFNQHHRDMIADGIQKRSVFAD